jgi:hypothetical protein
VTTETTTAEAETETEAPADLPEKQYRRPGFTAGRTVALCDGSLWTFPPTAVDHYFFDGNPNLGKPRDAATGPDIPTIMVPSLGRGHAYDKLMVVFYRADGGLAEIEAEFALIYSLFNSNYDVPEDRFRDLFVRLLPSAPGFEENQQVWRTLREIALGINPKPKAADAPAA